jgi:hypothetical protein
MPIQRRHAFNANALTDAGALVPTKFDDISTRYLHGGTFGVGKDGIRPPYLSCIPEGIPDREVTAAIMAMHGLSPYSWVVRATRADRVRMVGEKSCLVSGAPAHATGVCIQDYYQSEPHSYFPQYFQAPMYKSSALAGRELLNVCIASARETSLEGYIAALTRYIAADKQGAEPVDYVVIAFQLREALRLGARIYGDLTAVIANAYMLSLPQGASILCTVKKRGGI